MRKLRIVVLIDAWFPFHGGGQVHVREISKILKGRYNCEIEIFHGDSSNLILRCIWNIFATSQVIFSHIHRKFDLIHAHAYSAGVSGKILSLILKLPIVFTVHGSNNLDLDRKNFKSYLERFILAKIKYNCQISVSKSFLKYENVNKNIEIIENGVDIDKFQKQKSSTIHPACRQARHPSPVKLLFVGRLEEIKGVAILLKALAAVKDQLPTFILKIIGEGTLMKRLKELAQKLSLYSEVKFLGNKFGRELIKEYKNADLFILPSISEGQPLTLLEAWAAKLPVLATEVGDNKEFVKEGRNGFIVKPGSLESLSKGLLKAFNLKKEWKKLGASGYRLVSKNYTWEKTADKIYKVYKKLLNYS